MPSFGLSKSLEFVFSAIALSSLGRCILDDNIDYGVLNPRLDSAMLFSQLVQFLDQAF
jgi:hypothetical protein